MTRVALATPPPPLPDAPARGRWMPRFLLAGAVAGPLFVAVFVVDGFTEPGYDPLRHPVSSLSLGSHGWVQVLNFLVAGACYLGLGAGLTAAARLDGRAAGPRVLGFVTALVGVGLIGAGLFRTDPVSGYPPGTAGSHDRYTTPGALHDGLSALTFVGIPVAAALYAVWSARRGERRIAVTSAATAVLFVAGFVLASAAFGQAPGLVALGGLYQRLTVVVGLGWLTLLAARTRRRLRTLPGR